MEAFTLTAPRNIDGALAAAAAADSKFIAGGTDLIQLMKDWVERPRQLIDIDGLPVDRIELTEQGARIGALARMSDVADHAELRRHYPVIAEAFLASASPQLRNMASIGGNLLQRTRCGYFRDVGFPATSVRPAQAARQSTATTACSPSSAAASTASPASRRIWRSRSRRWMRQSSCNRQAPAHA